MDIDDMSRSELRRAEERVQQAQLTLRDALIACSKAHNRVALVVRAHGDVVNAQRHIGLAREDALSARCISPRDLETA